jgi:hypothetical protein
LKIDTLDSKIPALSQIPKFESNKEQGPSKWELVL